MSPGLLGALTHLRLYGARAAALRALREAAPADADAEAVLARDLSRAAGFAHAAPFFLGEQRQDLADAALAALRRDRDLCFRILFQAGLGALFVVGLAASGSAMTTALAVFAAFIALPSWALAAGGPTALVEALLAAPLAGRPARDLVNARLLSILGLLLGADTEPETARAVTESFVGTRLPDSALGAALTGRGFAAGKIALRPEAEDALLRGAARLTRGAQLRFRFLILGTSAIGLVALFTGGVQTLRREGLLPAFGPTPRGESVRIPIDDDRPRDATFLVRPATTSTGSP